MQHKHLQFGHGFRVVLGDEHSQAAQMRLEPSETEGGPGNRHRGADQWLYVVSGAGMAIDVFALDGETRRPLARTVTNRDGRCDAALVAGAALCAHSLPDRSGPARPVVGWNRLGFVSIRRGGAAVRCIAAKFSGTRPRPRRRRHGGRTTS